MKTYNSPMLSIVSINKSNIIETSNFGNSTTTQLAPSMRGFDDYYEGY